MPSKVSRSGVTHGGIRLHSQFSNRRSLAANQFSCILDREGAVCNGIVIWPYEAHRFHEQRANVSNRPETELWSHYSQAVFAQQFDAYVWFDETSAVTPLGPEHHAGIPETDPFDE